MKEFLKRHLPSRESVCNNRWLRWLGPALFDPHLWRPTRRGIALGVALGVFFGLLVPLAQIPLSVSMAVLLRANVPAAIASTLVTNPVTFGPVYYAAYHIGATLTGEGTAAPPPENAWGSITSIGKPLLLGLAIMASFMGLSAYLLVTWLWRRRRRRKPGPPRQDAAK